jgi:hypothetical protein
MSVDIPVVEQCVRDASVSEIKTRVDFFKSRLKGLCKGLVEPVKQGIVIDGEPVEGHQDDVDDPSYWAF